VRSIGQRSAQLARSAVRREQIDKVFGVADAIEDRRIGPRTIPVVIAVLVGIVVLVGFFLWPR